MASYRISIRAREQLSQIYEYTESQFGVYQADAYSAGLIRTFGLLADFPAIGQAVNEFRSGLRRFRFQSHFVYYSVSKDTVEIHAVLHHARQIRPNLFD